MTFVDIVNLWRDLPRWETGIPMSDTVAMKNFPGILMSPRERGWFKACHAWANGGPAPDQFHEIDEILKSLTSFQRKVAQAHLACARLAKAPFDQSFDDELASAATSFNLHKESLRELVNEIRLGRPRQTVGASVYITYPVISKKNNAAMLARFELQRLSTTETVFANTGRLFPAPEQIFSIEMDQHFQSTFNVAQEIASAEIRLHACEDVRVTIELLGQEIPPSLMSINGTSGSGALAIGAAKIRTQRDDALVQDHSKLRTLEFNSIAVTAELGPEGQLNPVGRVANKSLKILETRSLELLKTREAEIHEIYVLVVGKNQLGFGNAFDKEPKPKCFLWPQGNSHPVAAGAELRSPESLLVIRAVDLADAIDTLYKLQINIILSVLGKPRFIIAYLLTGHRWFLPVLLLLIFACWFLLPSFWFVLPGIAAIAAVMAWIYSRIKKVERQAEFYLQQRELSHSRETWVAMVATLQSYQSTRTVANICAWLKSTLARRSNGPLTLENLHGTWRGKASSWVRLLVLIVSVALLVSPFQHCLAEAVFPGTAKILGGQSRRGFVSNTKYASVQPTCGFKGCTLQMLVGAYGLIQLFLEHKDRSARFLRVSCIDSISYVKVDDTSAPSRQITVPIIDDRATFYYGIAENTPWEIELEVEVLCYCNGRLERLQIIGHRAPPGD